MGADANGSRWVEGLAEDPKDKISQKLKREHLFYILWQIHLAVFGIICANFVQPFKTDHI